MQTLMRPIPDNFKATLYSITVALLILCSLFVGPSLIFDMRQSRYPSQAVNFVKEHKIDGIVFNPYDWGGYLVWSLAPENTVFIDGRGINETAKRHAGIILLADKGKDAANPLWKRLLNAYNIHCIIISAVAKNGYVYPLIDEISRDNDWELVFAKDRSLVFLDNVKANQYIILNNKVPKDELINAIVRECELGIQETPATWGYYETLGLAYIKLNRFADARKMFASYLSMNPYNENIRNYYNLLSQYQRQE